MESASTSAECELPDITHGDVWSSVGQTSQPTQRQLDQHQADQSHAVTAYPPTDRGLAAWRFLAIAFVYETLLWGFPLSFGVFQAYYTQLPQFQDNQFISVIGTVASGIAYLAAPFMIAVVRRYARYKRHLILVGWPICLLGLVAGSFADTLPTLILTQGVMYGTGFILFYYPILSMVNDYWVTRRGMAYGILCGASGVSGAAMPFAVQALLNHYGYQITLRVIAVGLAVLTGPLIPFLKGRDGAHASTAPQTDWTFIWTTQFWVYSSANLAMSLAYFFPALYLPSYAISSGLSANQGALLLAAMSMSQVLGQSTFGFLSDRRTPIEVWLVLSTFIAAVAVYTCWGFARTLPVMLIFALIWGFTGTGFTALWGRIGSSISSDPETAFAAYGTFNVGKGLANICAGVIGGALIDETTTSGAPRYEKLILFTGSGMLASSIIVMVYGLRRTRSLLLSAT